jgi:hypothetical protein
MTENGRYAIYAPGPRVGPGLLVVDKAPASAIISTRVTRVMWLWAILALSHCASGPQPARGIRERRFR